MLGEQITSGMVGFITQFKIRQKLILLLLLIGLVPTILVSVIAYINISTQLTNKTVSQLASIAVKQNQKVNGLLQADQEDALKLANQYDLQAAISTYTTGQTTSSKAIDAILSAKIASQSSNLDSIALANTKDVVYASTAEGQIGQKLQLQDSAKAGQENSITVHYDPADDVDKLYLSTPMSVNQQDVGTLTLIYDTDDFIATVQDYTGLGTTGDTIIATQDSSGHTISLFPLRFDPSAALSTKLDSLHLFNHLNTTYRGVTDYRNHAVMVSTQPVAFANWVTATKIDTAEAFQPINQLRNALLVIVIASSVIIVIIALSFARFFTTPIITLTEKTRAIMQGDFNQRIAVTSNDEVGALATAFNDMTESLQTSGRKLGEEHARLQASFNSLNLGLLMTTRDGHVFMCNPAMLQILGITASEQVSGSMGNAISLEMVQSRLPNFDLRSALDACLTSGKSFTAGEISLGSHFISILGAPIRLNRKEVIGSTVVIEDITEAKILARSKDEFFSIASHELRTPLTAIKGNTSMILSHYPELSKDPMLKEMLGDIHQSSVRLIDIVNDFLDVSRIEQGKIVFKNEAFYMEKIIESVVYEMRAVLKEKNLYLHFDRMTLKSLPPVWADADRVKQIVYNLVGNAAKFTEEGGISISCEFDHEFLKVNITDTGRGIPLDKQELLFHKFQQAGDSLLTRDTSRGTGLGLYISRMLVDRMGGQVRLERSEVGIGTTFSFTLPTATKEQQKTLEK